MRMPNGVNRFIFDLDPKLLAALMRKGGHNQWTPATPTFSIFPTIGYQTLTLTYHDVEMSEKEFKKTTATIVHLEAYRDGEMFESFEGEATESNFSWRYSNRFTLEEGYYWQVGDVITTYATSTYKGKPVISKPYSYTIPEFKPLAPELTGDIYINDDSCSFNWNDT